MQIVAMLYPAAAEPTVPVTAVLSEVPSEQWAEALLAAARIRADALALSGDRVHMSVHSGDAVATARRLRELVAYTAQHSVP